MTYQPRTYRRYVRSKDLVSFRVTLIETDLFISADKDLKKEALSCIEKLRVVLHAYIKNHPGFEKSLKPVILKPKASLIIKDMARSGKACGVGPMAAVAGAVAEGVGRQLLKHCSQVIVENGGDIFISSKKPRIVGIYAGSSKFSKKIAIEISAEDTPCGICTSSGTVGHSLSFGKADCVVVLSKSTSLADAAATSICNKVKTGKDVDKAIRYGRGIKGINGILIAVDDTLGAWGNIKLVDI
ncbi:MAG: UPF0280 family protein [Candidatus Omnitrophica bacterium]|nr:UPF0280 family protein [Candidatus Omnitrophota bacterium]